MKYPLRVDKNWNEAYINILDSQDEVILSWIDIPENVKLMEEITLRLNWLSEYSNQFLIEMRSLQSLIGYQTRLNTILREEREEAEARYEKLLDWEY